jgi:hypothetical protein
MRCIEPITLGINCSIICGGSLGDMTRYAGIFPAFCSDWAHRNELNYTIEFFVVMLLYRLQNETPTDEAKNAWENL